LLRLAAKPQFRGLITPVLFNVLAMTMQARLGAQRWLFAPRRGSDAGVRWLALQDSCVQVRSQFEALLHNEINGRNLPTGYLAMFALSAIDPDPVCRNTASGSSAVVWVCAPSGMGAVMLPAAGVLQSHQHLRDAVVRRRKITAQQQSAWWDVFRRGGGRGKGALVCWLC
jgi:hypothetical protein